MKCGRPPSRTKNTLGKSVKVAIMTSTAFLRCLRSRAMPKVSLPKGCTILARNITKLARGQFAQCGTGKLVLKPLFPKFIVGRFAEYRSSRRGQSDIHYHSISDY